MGRRPRTLNPHGEFWWAEPKEKVVEEGGAQEAMRGGRGVLLGGCQAGGRQEEREGHKAGAGVDDRRRRGQGEHGQGS